MRAGRRGGINTLATAIPGYGADEPGSPSPDQGPRSDVHADPSFALEVRLLHLDEVQLPVEVARPQPLVKPIGSSTKVVVDLLVGCDGKAMDVDSLARFGVEVDPGLHDPR